MRIIILGAGILGASAAWHLARAGAEVEIVDAGLDGRATAAGAGIVSPWTSSRGEDWALLGDAAGRHYPWLIEGLAEDGESDTGYRVVGALVVDADPALLDAAQRAIEARGNRAPEVGRVTRLTPAEARAAFPPLAPELGAVHVSGAARVDGRRLATALLRAAERHGARRRSGHATLWAEGDLVRGVTLEGERLGADVVILAAGAWANALLAPLGVGIGVAPQRGQIVHLSMPGAATEIWPVVLPLSDHYLLAFDGGRVVVGATRETGSGFDHRVTAGGLASVLAKALGIAPGLAAATWLETRIGFRPLSEDTLPLLGAIPGLRGLLLGNGLGPSGLTLGPVSGKILADLALGRTPMAAAARFAPDRLVRAV